MSSEKSYFCNCLYFAAGSLSRNLTRLAEEAFSNSGLAPSHAFALLSILRTPGISPGDVAKELHMSPSTITRFLDKIEQKGLIQRNLSGKTYALVPTEKGHALKTVLEQSWQKLFQDYNQIIGKELAASLAEQIYDASEKLKSSDND